MCGHDVRSQSAVLDVRFDVRFLIRGLDVRFSMSGLRLVLCRSRCAVSEVRSEVHDVRLMLPIRGREGSMYGGWCSVRDVRSAVHDVRLLRSDVRLRCGLR